MPLDGNTRFMAICAGERLAWTVLAESGEASGELWSVPVSVSICSRRLRLLRSVSASPIRKSFQLLERAQHAHSIRSQAQDQADRIP